jgi:hypothetical protein
MCGRHLVLTGCLLPFLLHPDAKRSERARGLAKYLLESILNLGPTFM